MRTFNYAVRLDFCDTISQLFKDLYFLVAINGKMVTSGLDLLRSTNSPVAPSYKDIVVNSIWMTNGLKLQVGMMNQDISLVNAILNGVDIWIKSNSVNNLDGEFGVDGKKATPSALNTFAAVGFTVTRNSDTSSKTSIRSHRRNFYQSTFMLGPYFSFTELQEATKNFDSNAVIGVGVFGNVYSGTINDETKVTVKRGNL